MMANTNYGKFKGINMNQGTGTQGAGASAANIYARGGTAQGTF